MKFTLEDQVKQLIGKRLIKLEFSEKCACYGSIIKDARISEMDGDVKIFFDMSNGDSISAYANETIEVTAYDVLGA